MIPDEEWVRGGGRCHVAASFSSADFPYDREMDVLEDGVCLTYVRWETLPSSPLHFHRTG